MGCLLVLLLWLLAFLGGLASLPGRPGYKGEVHYHQQCSNVHPEVLCSGKEKKPTGMFLIFILFFIFREIKQNIFHQFIYIYRYINPGQIVRGRLVLYLFIFVTILLLQLLLCVIHSFVRSFMHSHFLSFWCFFITTRQKQCANFQTRSLRGRELFTYDCHA